MKLFLVLLILNCQAYASSWSVSTYNIRNFDNDQGAGPTNLKELSAIIKSVKSDAMGFQEVINLPAFRDVISKTLPGYVIKHSGCGGMGKQNLALVYNPAVFDFISQAEDLSFTGSGTGTCGSLRPLFLVTLKHKLLKRDFVFGLVHLKAGGDARAFAMRWNQYQKLQQVSKSYEKKNLILLGDFNSTGYNIKNEDYLKFESFISGADLRTLSENIACTNYWDGADSNPEYLPSTIDHIVVQDRALSSVQDVKVGAHCEKQACRPALPRTLGISFESVSDHCPIQVTFK